MLDNKVDVLIHPEGVGRSLRLKLCRLVGFFHNKSRWTHMGTTFTYCLKNDLETDE